MKSYSLFTPARFGLAGLMLVSAAAYAAAPGWTLDPGQNQLTFEGTQAGAPFTGRFDTWDANIVFDPQALDQSRVAVTIDTASAATGDPTKDGALPEADWFNSERYPQATFTSTAIREVSPGNYIADGTLSLKGQDVPVSLPFTVAIEGNRAVANGSLTFDRTQLGLGMQADPGAKWVGRDVDLKFTAEATRK
ncbi:YceI family protein [Altericroceibacterium xinjiangense]|uniref:YceI family protein n=1 Tax=Altericroceibacterium xinjiangense TaxID=762261 RepID=UPI000F7D97ED|nr:YceI family protein [Altericroceibacterium xinjiangense]